MAEQTGIAWTKSTFNPWIGCTKVGPGCDNCYADTMDARLVFKGERHWGAGVARMHTSEANWNKVRSWNAQAPNTEFAGRKGFWPVFCSSLADVFDNEVPRGWRMDLFKLIAETPNLTWLILTKRIGNVMKMCQHDGLMFDQLPNIWLGATVVNQEEADRDIPKLLQIPAGVRFLSMEPLLGLIDIAQHLTCKGCGTRTRNKLPEGAIDCCPDGANMIDWVIVGGESGSNARPMHPDWARSLRNQCEAADVPFFFKQWGEHTSQVDAHLDIEPNFYMNIEGRTVTESEALADKGSWQGIYRIGKKAAGDQLDHMRHNDFPTVVPTTNHRRHHEPSTC